MVVGAYNNLTSRVTKTQRCTEGGIAMRIAKLVCYTLIMLAVALTSAGCDATAKEVDPLKTYSLGELQADFLQCRKRIESSSPFLFTNKDELSKLFDDQYKLLKDGSDQLEFLRVLSPIVSELRCGHSHVYVSKDYEAYLREQGVYLPLDIRVIEDRLYTITDFNDIPAGSEITAINGLSAKDIVATLLKNLTADGFNETKKYYVLNQSFSYVYNYFLAAPVTAAAGTSQEYNIDYLTTRSQIAHSTVVKGVRGQGDNMIMRLPYATELPSELYSKQVYDDLAVLKIKLFMGFNRKDYNAFLQEFFKEVSEKGITNIILDVRGNWGGTPGPAIELYSYLISEPSPFLGKVSHPLFFTARRPVKPSQYRFTGNLYTLIDGADFSTTAQLLALLKHHRIGTLVGEEAGGGVICTDSSREITLRNTGVRLYSSSRPYEAAAPSLVGGRGIMPDIEVKLTLADYMYKLDPVMKQVIDHIADK